jgi:uncharacterized protein (TIGR03382 family)
MLLAWLARKEDVMKRAIFASVLAMLLGATTSATARPSRSDAVRGAIDHATMRYDQFNCSAGGPTSLLVGAAALGLVLRRRREA